MLFFNKKPQKNEEKTINNIALERIEALEQGLAKLKSDYLEITLNQKLLTDKVLKKIQLATMERQAKEEKAAEDALKAKSINTFNPFG